VPRVSCPMPTEPMHVSWGVLSTANIGRKVGVPSIVASTNGVLTAVASRDAARARAFAAEFGGVRAHGSYEALLADPDVDALYVPLPNALHEEWTVRALEAGKHVLCEKPLAPTAAACRRMGAAAAANGRLLMEAFMFRFHPRTRAVGARVAEGAVGRPRRLDAAFSFVVRRADDVRLSADLAGGALLDVGCYTVDAARRLLGEEPVEAVAFAEYGDSGVDVETVGLLRFPSGAVANVACALTLPRLERVVVHGDAGRIEVDRAFVASHDALGYDLIDAAGALVHQPVDGVDQYRLMVEAFADRVLGREPDAPTSDAAEAARTVAALEALAASARAGGAPVAIRTT
jgi:D-xylose 1-dehydrogenase (NADP+, D-xylono-1,5-lactone-forming)